MLYPIDYLIVYLFYYYRSYRHPGKALQAGRKAGSVRGQSQEISSLYSRYSYKKTGMIIANRLNYKKPFLRMFISFYFIAYITSKETARK